MIIWDHELIMRLLDVGAQPWLTVQMVQGKKYLDFYWCSWGYLDLAIVSALLRII